MSNRSQTKEPIYYRPEQSLIDYMHDLLKTLQNKDNLDAGELRRKKARLSVAKSRKILPEIIFPSMANLTFFFEAISLFPELQKTFESDIKELLGIRRLNPDHWNYGLMFTNLIAAMISVNKENNSRDDDRYYYSDDFRLRLTHRIQELIWMKIQLIPLFKTMRASGRVLEDIGRGLAWTEMIASRVNDEYDFGKLSSKYEKSKLDSCKNDEETKEYMDEVNRVAKNKFDEEAMNNMPTRTFNFDTKKLIES